MTAYLLLKPNLFLIIIRHDPVSASSDDRLIIYRGVQTICSLTCHLLQFQIHIPLRLFFELIKSLSLEFLF